MTFPRSLALFGAALFCPLPSLGRAEAPAHGFLDRTNKDADGKEAKYVLFVPDGRPRPPRREAPVGSKYWFSRTLGDDGSESAEAD
jgi:hypothetical protein